MSVRVDAIVGTRIVDTRSTLIGTGRPVRVDDTWAEIRTVTQQGVRIATREREEFFGYDDLDALTVGLYATEPVPATEISDGDLVRISEASPHGRGSAFVPAKIRRTANWITLTDGITVAVGRLIDVVSPQFDTSDLPVGVVPVRRRASVPAESGLVAAGALLDVDGDLRYVQTVEHGGGRVRITLINGPDIRVYRKKRITIGQYAAAWTRPAKLAVGQVALVHSYDGWVRIDDVALDGPKPLVGYTRIDGRPRPAVALRAEQVLATPPVS